MIESIYFDTCSIQRPLDSMAQTRIRLEAEAILGALEEIESGQIELISSTILELETSQTALAIRREHCEQILSQASIVVAVDENIAKRAAVFTSHGIKAKDALHLAAAESADADYFCTCDDRFLRRAKQIRDLKTNAVSPLELIGELGI